MEETTTPAPIDDGAQAAQPVKTGQQAAAAPQEPVSSQPAGTEDTAAWLQSKGVDPNDPEAFQKVASMAYNSEKQMTKATQEASKLRSSLSSEPVLPQAGTDPAMQEFMQDYKRDKQVNSFKESHPDWAQHEPTMVNILEQTAPNGYSYSQLVNSGFMSLEAVYAMAKGSAPVDTEQIKEQTRQETLQALANTQRAGGATAHASNTNPQAPKSDPIIDAIRKSRGE